MQTGCDTILPDEPLMPPTKADVAVCAHGAGIGR